MVLQVHVKARDIWFSGTQRAKAQLHEQCRTGSLILCIWIQNSAQIYVTKHICEILVVYAEFGPTTTFFRSFVYVHGFRKKIAIALLSWQDCVLLWVGHVWCCLDTTKTCSIYLFRGWTCLIWVSQRARAQLSGYIARQDTAVMTRIYFIMLAIICPNTCLPLMFCTKSVPTNRHVALITIRITCRQWASYDT